jgi:hypothetical protein
MADTAVAITAGSGTNIDTRTESTNGNHRQVVVLGDPATNAGVAPVDATNGLSVSITNASLTVASHAVTNAGTFATQVTAIAAGNNNIGDVDVASIAAGTNRIGTVGLHDGANAIAFVDAAVSASSYAIPVAIHPDSVNANGQATMANSAPVVLASNQSAVPVNGDVAHDAADSGNPAKVGGRARSSEMAAVANNDRADLITDLVGKLIVLPYANPENFVSGAITSAMTGTTSTSLVAAPGSGLRNYITQITVSNAHATVGTDVAIQDGNGGTTIYTIPAAAVYGGAVISFPTPLRQPSANTALYCANVTTGASTKVSAAGYKGA